MKEKHTSKNWIGYAVLWSLITSPCLILACDSPEDSIVTLLLLIAILLYITYKYGKEKGTIAGILMFVITILLNIAAAFLMYAILLELAWRNFSLAD